MLHLSYCSVSRPGIEKAKDPGIPANFPYKDQILAEIAEQRRQVAEAQEKRKEEKKAARLAAAEIEGEGGVRPAAVAGPSTTPGTMKPLGATQPVASDDEDVPILLDSEYPHFQAIFEKSDVILHVLDARDPLSFRSSQIESLVSGKSEQRIVFVLNKAGSCLLKPTKATTELKIARHVPYGVRCCLGRPFKGITSNVDILRIRRWAKGIPGRSRNNCGPRTPQRMGKTEGR